MSDPATNAIDDGKTRQAHLAWAKARAIEILDQGKIAEAYASLVSDIGKHPETREHPAMGLGAMLLLNGSLSTDATMRRFIEGFN